jgi:hypothetical protein
MSDFTSLANTKIKNDCNKKQKKFLYNKNFFLSYFKYNKLNDPSNMRQKEFIHIKNMFFTLASVNTAF